MTPRQAAAARDTASSRAKADAVRLALDVHVASNAATASATASQQMSMARLFQPTRNEAKDLLDLKQRTESLPTAVESIVLPHGQLQALANGWTPC